MQFIGEKMNQNVNVGADQTNTVLHSKSVQMTSNLLHTDSGKCARVYKWVLTMDLSTTSNKKIYLCRLHNSDQIPIVQLYQIDNTLTYPVNAPPIPVCGNCQKETRDTDELVLCESGCNFWYHRQCVSLTEEAYKLLKAEIFAEWVCDHCLSTKSIPPVKMKS
ncbi:hypothetical protein GJ496_011404 [Pomphorhynchus laevis]|nr:hypothetical protein GJ496_011404 [Pomphorhynchus laevis]